MVARRQHPADTGAAADAAAVEAAFAGRRPAAGTTAREVAAANTRCRNLRPRFAPPERILPSLGSKFVVIAHRSPSRRRRRI